MMFRRVYRRIFGKKRILPNPRWEIVDSGMLAGIELYLDLNQQPEFEKLLAGTYDRELWSELASIPLGPEPVFYDIGSFMGYHAINFIKIGGEKSSVHAFEPNPFNRQRILLNVERNHLEERIFCHSYALSDQNRIAQFMCNEDLDHGGSSASFVEGSDTFYPRERYNTYMHSIKIEAKKLDDIVSDTGIRLPDIIKIDVEGHEASVLRGMERTLSECSPYLFIELHSIVASYETVIILNRYGYNSRIINREEDGRCMVLCSKES